MPLLCISLLSLLLLPLSLSCKQSRAHVRDDYNIVETHLNHTAGNIATLLQNSSCPEMKHKLPNCTSNDVVETLLNLTCKMRNLRLSQTDRLATVVIDSLQCHCPERVTREPKVKPKRRTGMRRRRNEQRRNRRESKLCKAKAILSTMTDCYQILNLSVDT